MIPNFIIKGCAHLIAPILNHIFNLSLKSGVFPSSWKMSVVIPVHKSGDVCNVNNYRPISLLCAFSKVFEMVIYTRVSYYFRRKFSSAQHGFLKGRSVETNLCSFLGYSVPIVLSRGQVDTVYFDMTKAFDKVNHDLLLLKLSLYGVSPTLLNWFKTYLTDRRSSVRIANIAIPTLSFRRLGSPKDLTSGPYCSSYSSTTLKSV